MNRCHTTVTRVANILDLGIVKVLKSWHLSECCWSQFKRYVCAQTDTVWSDDWWFGMWGKGGKEGARKEVRGSE